jgi:hypothetical protein
MRLLTGPRMAWRNHAHSYVLDFGSAAKTTLFASDVDGFVGNESGQLRCPKGARHGGCASKKAWTAFFNILLASNRKDRMRRANCVGKQASRQASRRCRQASRLTPAGQRFVCCCRTLRSDLPTLSACLPSLRGLLASGLPAATRLAAGSVASRVIACSPSPPLLRPRAPRPGCPATRSCLRGTRTRKSSHPSRSSRSRR